jgi:hypothetical protein
MTGDTEVGRFFAGLSALDSALASDDSLSGPVENPVEKLIQGPLADALTHVGQLAMLRGMAGVPIQPESYAACRHCRRAASDSIRRLRAHRSTAMRALRFVLIPLSLDAVSPRRVAMQRRHESEETSGFPSLSTWQRTLTVSPREHPLA